MYSDRQAASFDRDNVDSSTPSTFRLPSVGLSMPAMRLSSVVLPLPLGPISARNVPASTSRSRPSSGLITVSPLRYARVSPRHSISGCLWSSMVAMGPSRLFFADDSDPTPLAQARRVARHQCVARLEPRRDRDPPVEPAAPQH